MTQRRPNQVGRIRLGKICVLTMVSRWYRQYKANAKRHICVDPSLLDKGRSARVQSAALTAGQRNREGLEDNPLMA